MELCLERERTLKATPQQQSDLLALSMLDIRIDEVKARRMLYASGSVVSQAREKLSAANEVLLARRYELDELKVELKRAQADLDLVEQRIQRDEERLQTSSNAKDVEGISHEIQSLKTRKSTLEDAELAVMENLESCNAAFEEALANRDECAHVLSSEEALMSDNLAEIEKQLQDLAKERDALVKGIAAELLELYNKRAARGIPVGALTGRECGACRIALTSTAFDDITSVAHDELAYCPNCSAILVR